MNHWLLKSEPSTWSWDNQRAKGESGTAWDGVRNFQAANNLKAMAIGDLAFFYHSGEERAIIGLVQVIATYRPDPSDKTGRFGLVDVKAHMVLPKPVTLSAIKAEPALSGLALIKQSRLSVMPVSAAHFKMLCKMGGLKASELGL